MKATSLKAKIKNALIKGGFKPSTSSKSSGVRGFSNTTAGFTFRKSWDNYYLCYTCGNMLYRGMPIEQQEEQTKKMYDWLVANGYEKWIAYGEETFGRKQAITLKHEND